MWEHTEHLWGPWVHHSIRSEEDVFPDPEDGRHYYYYRTCQIMGCTFCEKSVAVAAVGPTKVYDPEPIKPWHKKQGET